MTFLAVLRLVLCGVTPGQSVLSCRTTKWKSWSGRRESPCGLGGAILTRAPANRGSRCSAGRRSVWSNFAFDRRYRTSFSSTKNNRHEKPIRSDPRQLRSHSRRQGWTAGDASKAAVTRLRRADDPERSAACTPHAVAVRGHSGSQPLDELGPIFARIGLQMQRDVVIERDGRESAVHSQQRSRVLSSRIGPKVGGLARVRRRLRCRGSAPSTRSYLFEVGPSQA